MEKLVRGVNFIELSEVEDQRCQNVEYQFHFIMKIMQPDDDWNVNRKAV